MMCARESEYVGENGMSGEEACVWKRSAMCGRMSCVGEDHKVEERMVMCKIGSWYDGVCERRAICGRGV